MLEPGRTLTLVTRVTGKASGDSHFQQWDFYGLENRYLIDAFGKLTSLL